MFRLIGFFGFMLMLFAAMPAAAFLPDDEGLQEELDKRYGAMTSWEAEMTFPAYPDVKAHLWYARGKWRQEWTADSKAVAVGRGFNVVARCTDGEFAKSPLFVWMVPNQVASWNSWGADSATRSFGFCDGTPCLSLGAEPDDATATVVQLNNEDMSPILIRFLSGNTLTSVEYADYRTLGGFRVPQTVRVTIGAEHVLETRVKWIAVNRADGEELYARDGMDASPCETPSEPFDLLRDAFHYPQPR